MASSIEVSDSTDWLTTALPLLAPLETALRCQVCKDFYDTPMITSCAHTFCSLCIRKCLSSDGRCPICREQDQASKLRRNWAIHEVVDAFQAARSQTLEVAQKYATKQSSGGTLRQRKRKRPDPDLEEGRQAKSPRQTRSQSRKTHSAASSQNIISVDDSETASDDDAAAVVEAREPNDGLYSCPICGKRMKEELVWPHIDKSHSTSDQPESQTKPSASHASSSSINPQKSSISHISQFNYSLLKDGPLRKKLDEIGISSRGPRELMIRRHTEWVNLYNANADSSSPRPTRDLHRDLQAWERTQGGQASSKESMTKKKDFDGQGWARGNKDQFSDLIRQARAKVASKPGATEADETTEETRAPPELEFGQAVHTKRDVRHRLDDKSAASSARPLGMPSQSSHFTDSIAQDGNSKQRETESTDLNGVTPVHTSHKPTPSLPVEDSLPEHFKSADSKKIPMFALPSDPIRDVDGIEFSR